MAFERRQLYVAEKQTLIAELIDSADLDAKYDAQAKRPVSLTVILAWILKSCVDEFKEYDIDYIMTNCFAGAPEISQKAVNMDMPDAPAKNQYVPTMNSESSSIKENTVRSDIRFKARVPKSGEIIEIIVNVEIQVDASSIRRVIRRGLYYCDRMVSEQFGRDFFDEEYENRYELSKSDEFDENVYKNSFEKQDLGKYNQPSCMQLSTSRILGIPSIIDTIIS